MREQDKLLYGFVGACAGVALAFVLAAIGTRLSSRDIDVAATDLLSNALPSVTELMNARTAAHRLEVDVQLLAKTPAVRPSLFDEVKRARTDVDESLRAERRTPWYGGERELFEGQVTPRLAQLDRGVEELEAALATNPTDEPRLSAASGAVAAAASQLDSSLDSLAQLNHAQSYAAASRIVGTRAYTARMAFLLEAISAVVATIAAAVAVRAARRFAQVAHRNVELEADRANELDVFAQRVAHDLMSPLAAVTLSLGAIQRAHPDPETTRQLDRVRRALERSRQMVQGIYSFSRAGAQAEQSARAPLRAIILDAIDEQLATEDSAPPTFEVEPFDEVEVASEPAVLRVVVSNLLSNASKFTRESPVRRITVRAAIDEGRVHVEVEDTGPGIPPRLEKPIFEPYGRAPGVTQPGLGLGLATVKRIVLAYGGAVGVRPARTGGAIFWFDLPRAPEGPAESQPPAESHEERVVH
jgi:signal transduction histidine kinase